MPTISDKFIPTEQKLNYVDESEEEYGDEENEYEDG